MSPVDLPELLISGIRRRELARVAGNVPGPEANVGAVSTTRADSNGKAALTVYKKILPGNIQLRNVTRRRTLIEKGDFTSGGLPDRHNTKSDCARRDAGGIRN
jgi:hypothetical protein